jgi:hypothetical protein
MADGRVLDAHMSASDSCVSNWPCGLDCCHASPLAGDDRLWCSRQVPLPAKRTVLIGEDCAWFCVKPPVTEHTMSPVLS